VADFISQNRANFTGIALLGHDGDKRYPQAPRESVLTDDDAARWNRLHYTPIDETALKEVLACAGGKCELP
jgi:hypothetical protein